MFTTKTLVTVLAVIAALHGYIYLSTEQVHPCRAAETRLLGEYGPLAFKVGLGALGEGLLGKKYRPESEEERKLIRKSENVGRFGVAGCYLPAVLGWKAVPPI
jgi:hypothetical protein